MGRTEIDMERRDRPWLTGPAIYVYIVHMKRVTASEARKHWFRLLDEVAAGETVVIERKGRRIVLRRDTEARAAGSVPDYSTLLRVLDPSEAAEWGWEWEGPEGDLRPKDAR